MRLTHGPNLGELAHENIKYEMHTSSWVSKMKFEPKSPCTLRLEEEGKLTVPRFIKLVAYGAASFSVTCILRSQRGNKKKMDKKKI